MAPFAASGTHVENRRKTAPRSFQDLILAPQRYWADQGCVLPQPYDMEMGAGNSDLCEVALALKCLYDVPVEMNLTEARRVSALVQQAGQYKVDGWRPVVGDNLFIRESGAVASQFHLPESRHAELLARVKEKSTAAKRLITDEEFRQLAGAAIRAQG